jgi:hypothetical protein
MSAKASSQSTVCASCSNVTPRASIQVAPCGHCFCCACLKRMARLTLKDRTLVPLRCCRKELSTESVAFAFSLSANPTRRASDLAKYKTLLAERTRNWQSAPSLVSDDEYAATVKLVGAKQCPGCGVGVQRDYGCVHMKCPNGHEFCFTCLAVWRRCNCALIPEPEVRDILGEN